MTATENRDNLEFNLNPEIGFNYLGQTNETENIGIFEFSSIAYENMISPDSAGQYTFEFNGIVVNNKLVFKLRYNKFEYNKRTVEHFAELFKQRLIEIIEHCIEQDETEITPSDLINDSLSLDELDEINDMIIDL